MSRNSKVFDWFEGMYDNLGDTAVIASAVAATAGSNAFFRRYNTTTVTAFSWLIGARVGVELAGSLASHSVDKDKGLENWFKASDAMFRNRTVLGSVPVLGSALTMVPNPIGVGEVLFQAGMKIGEYTAPMVGITANLFDSLLDGVTHRLKNPPIKFRNPLPRAKQY